MTGPVPFLQVDDPRAPGVRLAETLRARRKALGISMAAAAETAHISRLTWHRLEKGEATVALGSLLAALDVLGLQLRVEAPGTVPVADTAQPSADAWLPLRIGLQDYPGLRRLAWQLRDGVKALSPREALGLYERNWRHLDEDRLEPREKALIHDLREALGETGHGV